MQHGISRIGTLQFFHKGGRNVHKFLRTVGFSDVKKKDMEIILKDIIEYPDVMKVTRDSEGNEFAELSKEYAPNVGIRVCGTYEDDENFHMEYYYPYFDATAITTQEFIEIQKHAEKESYAGICDESSLGVTLIFYIQNVADYLAACQLHKETVLYGAKLAALSTEGKILLPVEKKVKKKAKSCDYNRRSKLVAQAREGDEDAIESLTLEDMDTYSLISKRVMNEDVLSIVATYFMPYGVESDQYAVLGEIVELSSHENKLSKETVYQMKIECNDIQFDVCINEKDLMGQPEIGRRFKGNIWMQGNICL
jgi:hypothetical protein